MRDTMKPFRLAIAAVLTGNISYNDPVPIYDKKVFTSTVAHRYIYFGTQRESDITATDCAWECKSSIDIVIVDKTGSEVSQDVVDDISDQIYDLLLTEPGGTEIAMPDGFSAQFLRAESVVAGNVQISPTESVLQKVITLTANITQS